MKKYENTLGQELQLAGAKNSEIAELISIAGNLRQLPTSSNTVAARRFARRRVLLPLSTAFAALCLITVALLFSQTVSPGSWLYPVQKISDNAVVAIRPSYRGTLMMKRALQVNQLVARKASSHVILATLADYQREAVAYKTGTTNYAVFDYCKSNLQQAARMATGPEQQAITDTLSSLQHS